MEPECKKPRLQFSNDARLTVFRLVLDFLQYDLDYAALWPSLRLVHSTASEPHNKFKQWARPIFVDDKLSMPDDKPPGIASIVLLHDAKSVLPHLPPSLRRLELRVADGVSVQPKDFQNMPSHLAHLRIRPYEHLQVKIPDWTTFPQQIRNLNLYLCDSSKIPSLNLSSLTLVECELPAKFPCFKFLQHLHLETDIPSLEYTLPTSLTDLYISTSKQMLKYRETRLVDFLKPCAQLTRLTILHLEVHRNTLHTIHNITKNLVSLCFLPRSVEDLCDKVSEPIVLRQLQSLTISSIHMPLFAPCTWDGLVELCIHEYDPKHVSMAQVLTIKTHLKSLTVLNLRMNAAESFWTHVIVDTLRVLRISNARSAEIPLLPLLPHLQFLDVKGFTDDIYTVDKVPLHWMLQNKATMDTILRTRVPKLMQLLTTAVNMPETCYSLVKALGLREVEEEHVSFMQHCGVPRILLPDDHYSSWDPAPPSWSEARSGTYRNLSTDFVRWVPKHMKVYDNMTPELSARALEILIRHFRMSFAFIAFIRQVSQSWLRTARRSIVRHGTPYDIARQYVDMPAYHLLPSLGAHLDSCLSALNAKHPHLRLLIISGPDALSGASVWKLPNLERLVCEKPFVFDSAALCATLQELTIPSIDNSDIPHLPSRLRSLRLEKQDKPLVVKDMPQLRHLFVRSYLPICVEEVPTSLRYLQLHGTGAMKILQLNSQLLELSIQCESLENSHFLTSCTNLVALSVLGNWEHPLLSTTLQQLSLGTFCDLRNYANLRILELRTKISPGNYPPNLSSLVATVKLPAFPKKLRELSITLNMDDGYTERDFKEIDVTNLVCLRVWYSGSVAPDKPQRNLIRKCLQRRVDEASRLKHLTIPSWCVTVESVLRLESVAISSSDQLTHSDLTALAVKSQVRLFLQKRFAKTISTTNTGWHLPPQGTYSTVSDSRYAPMSERGVPNMLQNHNDKFDEVVRLQVPHRCQFNLQLEL